MTPLSRRTSLHPAVRTPRALFLLSVAFTAATAAAQPSDADVVPSARGRCDLTILAPAPPWSITARQIVGAAAEQANVCLGQRDAVCADTALAPAQSIALSDDERGLLALPRAELAAVRGDNAGAEAIHREALASPALNDSLRREIALRLAILLSTRGELAEAMRVLDSNVGCGQRTAESLTLQGILYQGLAARAFAIEHFEAAMRLYPLEGQAVPPTLQERHATLAADEPKTAPEGTHPVPLLRVNPNYPQRALQAGRDGWVELEFDITDMGAVANVGVVASSNEDFEQASIASLQRWRYAPKFENGLPVSQDDLRTIISFCVDSCDSRGKPPSRPSSDGARRDSNEDSPKE